MLNDQMGHRNSETRRNAYEEREREEIRAKSPETRRRVRAAVMTGGFCGFMLGTTANAVANMEALVERYGPAPRAFLVVPMVGAFFIDFTSALIITTLVNFWR